jgi:hypothetical protein
MLAKYKVDYSVPFNGHQTLTHHQLTNDPVACEQLLAEVLERGFKIHGISHEGVELPKVEADKMIKTAASLMATRHLCASLGIDTVEAHRRFGTAA